MALSSLTKGTDTASKLAYETASITPPSGIVFALLNAEGQQNLPTVTATGGWNGVGWNSVSTIAQSGDRVRIMWALASGGADGIITFTWSTALSGLGWDIISAPEANTTTPVVAGSSTTGNGAGETAAPLTMPTFADAANIGLYIAGVVTNTTVTIGGGYTGSHAWAQTNFSGVTGWATNDNTPTATFSAANWMAAAVEINVTTGLDITDLRQHDGSEPDDVTAPLEWTAHANAVELHRSDIQGFAPDDPATLITDTLTGASTTWNDATAGADILWYYIITGASTTPIVSNETGIQMAPPKPLTCVIAEARPTEVDVTITETTSTDRDRYAWWYRVKGTTPWQIHYTDDSANLTHTYDTLTSGTTYEFMATAISTGLGTQSGYGPVAEATPGGATSDFGVDGAILGDSATVTVVTPEESATDGIALGDSCNVSISAPPSEVVTGQTGDHGLAYPPNIIPELEPWMESVRTSLQDLEEISATAPGFVALSMTIYEDDTVQAVVTPNQNTFSFKVVAKVGPVAPSIAEIEAGTLRNISTPEVGQSTVIHPLLVVTPGDQVHVGAIAYSGVDAGGDASLPLYVQLVYSGLTDDERDQIGYDTQNLLGPDAGNEHIVAGYFYQFVGWSETVEADRITLDELALQVGDILSASAWLKVSDVLDITYFRVRFFDSGNLQVGPSFQSTGVSSLTYARYAVENITIPATTVSVSFILAQAGGAAGSQYIKWAKINRGPIATTFTEPPIRANREKLDDIPGDLGPTGGKKNDADNSTAITTNMQIYQGYEDGDTVTFSGMDSPPQWAVSKYGYSFVPDDGSWVGVYSATSPQRMAVYLEDVTASSATVKARVTQNAAVTVVNTDGTGLSPLTDVGSVQEKSLISLPALDNEFTVRWDWVITYSGAGGGSGPSDYRLEVGIWSYDTAGSPVLRATRQYLASTSSDSGSDSVTISASEMQTSGADRIRLTIEDRGIVSGNTKAIWTVSVDAFEFGSDGDYFVTHQNAGQAYAPATDASAGVTADFVVWDTT